MRKYLWSLGLFIALWFGMVVGVRGANLSQTTIRVNRNSAAISPLPVLVIVKTQTATVENGLRITVGSGWSVNGTAANITTSISGLPVGVSAFPGMSTASGVSGQVINFPGNDLVSGATYGFYITGGIGVNPSAGDGAPYKWLVQTLNGGNPADQMEIKVAVVSNDQVTVTGRVGANASDFQLEMVADKTGTLNQGEIVTYEITYGSYLLNSTKPLKIIAEWSRGTLEGSPSPSVDVVDYVVGSGTTAYGAVNPVIDLLNRRIEWTINNFPANTLGEKVSFSLEINNNYSGQSRVNFDVTGYLNGANVVSVSQTINNVYQPPALPTTTPTPLPSVTPTPGSNTTESSGSTSTPTPTPTAQVSLPLNISKVEVTSLTTTGISIGVLVNKVPETVRVVYGSSVTSLVNNITSINKLKADQIGIDGLVPNRDYYFRVLVTDELGVVRVSDIYTFKTASSSDAPEVDKKSLVVTAGDNILLDAQSETLEDYSLVMTPKRNYAIKVNLTKKELIKSVRIEIKDSRVLGINTIYGAEPNAAGVDLTESSVGGYTGHLVTPTSPGYYEIYLRVEDFNGNISHIKIGEIRIVETIIIVDEKNKPVENAKVLFYHYDSDKKMYVLLPSEYLGLANPSYSEYNGEVAVTLPKGQYRIEVWDIGYKTKTVDFSLGLGADEILPRVVLSRKNINIFDVTGYYGNIVTDTYKLTGIYLVNLGTSSRFYSLMAVLVLFSSLVILWNYLSGLLAVEWWLLPKMLYKNIFGMKKSVVPEMVEGRIIDDATGKGIDKAEVFLLSGKSSKVLFKQLTDDLGYFHLKTNGEKKYRLAAVKDGFAPTPILEYSQEGLLAGGIVLRMENTISPREKLEAEAQMVTGGVSHIGISTWLLGSLAMELLFWQKIGLWASWPWVVLSWLNMGLWIKMMIKTERKKT